VTQQAGKYSQLASALVAALHLQQAPVAISFTDHVPSGVEHHGGHAPAGCRFWEDAQARVFATTSDDHRFCAIGMHTHNLAPTPAQQTDLMDALKVFADLDYVRPEDVASIPVLQSRPEFVVYAPLSDCAATPDVVLLLVNASQTLILAEAVQQEEHQAAPAMGRPACAVVPQVANTGQPALSLGCCGARAYLDCLPDGTAIFAIPGAKLEAYVQRIATLARANGVLAKFHQLRRRDIEGGNSPSIQESLTAMSSPA
jgi:uncharacterized protein (DUF169 family)